MSSTEKEQEGIKPQTADNADAASIGHDDDAIIPKGQIDPVYEAKARVLNHAVRAQYFPVPSVRAPS
jgi:hypothetical protein